MTKKDKTPWPTKDVMTQIYEKHLWGGESFDFYSGDGSHHQDIIHPYLKGVISFLNTFESPLSIVDLGCGDFNIGKHLLYYVKNYFAIDIVPSLIERNKNNFKADNLEFHCLNIAEDHLPNADCAIVRQVLQHLSNKEVMSIINKLKDYKYLILTEHIPLGSFEPNKDIISGQGIRLKHNSGINLLAEPFNLKVKAISILNIYQIPNKDESITTYLYRLF